ncbi:BZ3500_MvSof-1268-A1-R1_Chr3-3g06438 [Microbotryum saponariae]|uniref:BZ3500_MvSof-1268-A1-R1_Chr3-3g06438 protein n=1 Tax=Microbotryum saponariae TaxID=289078 RepID=A0A2X0LNU0_9BASI|nr:BZ3500_MvSof-1268-A1-R1_Chr3-3g06438 [Microbotryum saponariae]SDA04405.1 BZ3501_MvSof-1269-A2-R1_Chr3-2g06125 [Microbotryum saponariae]
MSPDGAVAGSDQSTSGRGVGTTGGAKVMNAKRGRKQDDSLQPSRARDVQRAFRARRAEQLSTLEDQVRTLQQENTELKRELAYYKGETNCPVASTSTSQDATAADASTSARSATTESAATLTSAGPGPRRGVKRTKSSSKDLSPASILHEDRYKEGPSRSSLAPGHLPLEDEQSRSMSQDQNQGSRDKPWGLGTTTTYVWRPTQQIYTPRPPAAATPPPPPWSHPSYSTLPPQQDPSEAVGDSPQLPERPAMSPLPSKRRKPSSTTTTMESNADSPMSPTYPIHGSAPSATTGAAPADSKTNSAASVLVEWSKQASARSCSTTSSSCCAPSVPAPSADLTARELCGPSADADCCQPPHAEDSTIEVKKAGSQNEHEGENGSRHYLLSVCGGLEGNASTNANAKGLGTAKIKNIAYDPNLCCGGLIDCSGPLFENSSLPAEQALALAEASRAVESGAVA